jgi:hypothetical protein
MEHIRSHIIQNRPLTRTNDEADALAKQGCGIFQSTIWCIDPRRRCHIRRATQAQNRQERVQRPPRGRMIATTELIRASHGWRRRTHSPPARLSSAARHALLRKTTNTRSRATREAPAQGGDALHSLQLTA